MTAILLVLLLATPADAQSRRERRAAAAAEPAPVAAVEPAPAPPDPEPGSLWSDVQARQLMGLDGNARRVGDLVTVHVDEAQVTTLDASTSADRSSSTQLGVGANLGSEGGFLDQLAGEGISVKGDNKNHFDGAGKTSRSAALAAIVTCEVVEVMANGNLRIEGVKTVRVNNEAQYLTVSGVARPRDIQMDNTLESALLATSTIELTGKGVVADKQRPGLLARIADAIWPF